MKNYEINEMMLDIANELNAYFNPPVFYVTESNEIKSHIHQIETISVEFDDNCFEVRAFGMVGYFDDRNEVVKKLKELSYGI